jgi:DNA-3-methyladenine glycosylase I
VTVEGQADKGHRKRCQWAEKDLLLQRYHDEEWGEPVEEDEAFFERLVLEIFQAGLNWRLILHKREAFRRAFSRFSITRVASFREREIERLLADRGIVRNRKKVEATIENAKIFSEIVSTHGSFKNYLVSFSQGDKELLLEEFKRRFRFMGPKIAESFLESVGEIPPPHDPDCWKYDPQ